MKLYLIETPNDVRTWDLNTYNQVSPYRVDSAIEIEEDSKGSIFIEQYTDKKTLRPFFYRVSSDNNKLVYSDWIKRFSVK